MSGAKVVALAAHPGAVAVRSHASALQAGAVAVLGHVERVRAKAGAPNPNNWIGPKHQRGRDLKLVARDIRRDIRAAIKAGQLPAGLVVSVRISRYSMGQGLQLECEAPQGFQIHDRAHSEHGRYTAQAARLRVHLLAITRAYNRVFLDLSGDSSSIEFSLSISLK